MYKLLEDGTDKPNQLVTRARHRINFLKSITMNSYNSIIKPMASGDVPSTYLLNQEKLMKHKSMFHELNNKNDICINSFDEDQAPENKNLLYGHRPSIQRSMFEESKRESIVTERFKDANSLDVGFEAELPRFDSNHLQPDI